ncbi:hypothetical protein RvY_05637 [Ramazzottius varieornatus]|uniref:Etoposide-induced protein 2.4 homolog n=1 Tax=Ramazzottius varieornatus TaxID=947166 RepID=A0A1D1UVQ4_RAMVA|nr:hypothetical protein RvY_05637 [Ramazzottius varieornatus]
MSTNDLLQLTRSFVYGVRDALSGFTIIHRLKSQDTQNALEGEKTTLAVVTELQRRRVERLPVRPEKKSERPKIRRRILQCCLLNGGVFLASIFAFEHLILPVLEQLTLVVLGHKEAMRVVVWSWVSFLMSAVFKVLWILPLFVLSRVVSFTWFQDIADAAYNRFHPRTISAKMSPGMFIADVLFSLLVQTLFLCQAQLASALPIPAVAQILFIFHLSLLNAFYAFEYKWFNLGWEVNKRVSYVEARWPYFLGFGLPLALATSYTESYWINGCIFSVLFPLLIVCANEASPNEHSAPFYFPVFTLVVSISNVLFSRGTSKGQKILSKASREEVNR